MATASAAYRHERLFKADERKKQWLGRNIHRLDFSSSRQPRDACLRRSGGDCLPELSHMPPEWLRESPPKIAGGRGVYGPIRVYGENVDHA